MKTPPRGCFWVIDLGAAPGSWSQALSRHFISLQAPFKIIALDKQGTLSPLEDLLSLLSGI